jgi:hypothetical protein
MPSLVVAVRVIWNMACGCTLHATQRFDHLSGSAVDLTALVVWHVCSEPERTVRWQGRCVDFYQWPGAPWHERSLQLQSARGENTAGQPPADSRFSRDIDVACVSAGHIERYHAEDPG